MKLRKMMVVLVALLMILTIFSGCKKTTEDQLTTWRQIKRSKQKQRKKRKLSLRRKKEQVTLQLFQSESWWPYTAWEGRIPELVTEITGVKHRSHNSYRQHAVTAYDSFG